jgi:outer membrane protein TolC
VSLATETLALVRVQRDAGTATQLDLLVAQDTLINSEVNVARARFDLGLTAVQLRRATGVFPYR